ncbi:hypothetical protein [Bradyrhizobium sp. SBR1B]|nr:hypothetical protein [Bradyrhizobium sp. SBR1B]MBB4383148.1 hypothetical protein [Bradyrhizobium sp. SBR1B]
MFFSDYALAAVRRRMKSVSSARLSRIASGRATWKLRPGVGPSEQRLAAH